MTVQEIVDLLQADIVAGNERNDNVISGGYASDLLSNVMGQARLGCIWVTMQAHQNIVAVASLLGLSAVVIAGGVQPNNETILKAERERIPLLTTSLSAFEVIGLLYGAGIKGG